MEGNFQDDLRSFFQGGETESGDKRRDNSSNDSYWYRRQNERQEEKERELTE